MWEEREANDKRKCGPASKAELAVGGGTDRAEPCDLLYLNRMFLSQENHTMAYFQIEPKVLCKPHPCPGLCFFLLAPPWTHSSLPDMVSVPGLCNFLASQSLYLLTPMPLGDSFPFHPICPGSIPAHLRPVHAPPVDGHVSWSH